MTKHPNDEFDRVPEFTDRKGIHRQTTAGAATRRSPLGWIVAFGIFALVVGLFSYFVLPQLTGEPVAAPAAGSSSASQSPSQTPGDAASSASGDAAKKSTDDSAAAESSAAAQSSSAAAKSAAAESEKAKSKAAAESSSSAAAASSSAAAAAPDTSTKVGVFNGSRRSGLAAAGQTTLSAAGFSNLSAANWTKHVSSSIVYYKSDQDKATAQQAANALGINAVYQTSRIPGRIAVVLGADY